ncbi:MAG: hypothetical protein IKV55_06175 [Oscillospiraceae bacterium]|nr:hypothetical protein [Oscillospiraceae bacterium]
MKKAVVLILLAALCLGGCSAARQESELQSFSFVHTGSSAADGWSYSVRCENGEVLLGSMKNSGAETVEVVADTQLLARLGALLSQHEVASWGGLLRRLFAADKESFSLYAAYENGSSIDLQGTRAPENYAAFCSDMHALFAEYLSAVQN